MLLTTAQFAQLSQLMGIFVLACALVTGTAFIKQWGWRFRMVGITGFSVVLTVGLFALSLAPLVRTPIANTTPYTVVFDRLSSEAVITVQPDPTTKSLNAESLTATLQQAASNLFSPGRTSQGKTNLTIRARVLLHPRPGVTQPIYVGKIQRSLRLRDDPNMQVELFPAALAQISQN
jgi:hypothetical protein